MGKGVVLGDGVAAAGRVIMRPQKGEDQRSELGVKREKGKKENSPGIQESL